MKEFFYYVNGTEFVDTEAFGKAWKEAKALATEEHTCITRTVVKGKEMYHEFFAKGGCFLSERFYEKDRVKIF
jgi:hypothetical protein